MPFASLPEADLVEMVEALVRPWQALAVRGTVRAMLSAEEGMLDWGWLLRLRERGVSVGPAPDPAAGTEAMERLMLEGAVPMFYGWIPLRLTRERARELQRALVDVVLRFSEDEGPEAHLLGLALAPVGEEGWGEAGKG